MQSVIELPVEYACAGRIGAASRWAALCRLPDERLMDLVAHDRDQLAFAVLYDRHAAIAFAAAMRICRERALAEDALQDAFLSMWRARESYDSRRGSVRGWVMRIVHNGAIDVLRRGLHDRGGELLVEQALEDRWEALQRAEDQIERHEWAATLGGALARLPSEQRSVIELAYYGGYSQAEIATMSRVPLGTIKGRGRLALQKLRAELAGGQALV